jgi:uncharacterized protein YegL
MSLAEVLRAVDLDLVNEPKFDGRPKPPPVPQVTDPSAIIKRNNDGLEELRLFLFGEIDAAIEHLQKLREDVDAATTAQQSGLTNLIKVGSEALRAASRAHDAAHSIENAIAGRN